ncbi:MAG TPA: pyrroline-5-carboxylate reductase [Caulobacter sp.]|nr:pyrroline-5-carboxylate reductase [Caulobacter sp.]
MSRVLLLGAGRMGGALVSGWMFGGSVSVETLMIRDPFPGAEAKEAVEQGARLNPADVDLMRADTVVLAVKPQLWRDAAAAVEPWLAHDAVIISVVAGVGLQDLREAFGSRFVARVMPTIAVAVSQGTATVYSDDDGARDRAHLLFEGVAQVVDVDDEGLMHAATAVSGSGPAYLYAFVEALEAAGLQAGLSADAAVTLARSTITGAASLMSLSDASPAELRRQVTSPGGTTQAALEVLMGEGGLQDLLDEAVAAAVRRSKELG